MRDRRSRSPKCTILELGRGDTLVTNASDVAITGGLTSAQDLTTAFKAGAKLYSLPSLHAKVVCLGRHVVVGSANASVNSAEELIEAGVVSDDARLRAHARAFIEQLTANAALIEAAFLERARDSGCPKTPKVAMPRKQDARGGWHVQREPLPYMLASGLIDAGR